MLLHASYYLDEIRHDARFFIVFKPLTGLIGVSLFFAISGHLMARLAAQLPAPERFLAHRAVRIYPAFWIATSAVVLMQLLAGTPAPWAWFDKLLLPGGQVYDTLGVTWSLTFELPYYMFVFAVLCLGLGRWLRPIAAAWLAGVVWVYFTHSPWQHQATYTLPFVFISERSVPFIMGLLLPLHLPGWLPRHVSRAGLVLLAVMAISFVTWTGMLPYWVRSNWIVGLASAALVAAAVDWPVSPASWAAHAATKLGDWSYALYLCHVPLIRWVYQMAPPSWSGLLLWPCAILAALACGCAFGMLDIGLYRWLRQQTDQMPRTVLRGASSVYVAVWIGAGIYRALQ